MMNKPKIIKLNYSYKKEKVNLWALNLDDIPIDKDVIKDTQIVHFSPGTIGGNHKHPRIEWYIGIGELVLYWLDEEGNKHEQFMSSDEGLLLIKIPPFVPHAVKNISEFKFAVLFEYADAKQYDVEKVTVI